jgi:hypothetical protein
MHNIDRTLSEFEPEYENYENAFEFEFEDEYEDNEASVFSEAEEMELASELLSVSNEEELEQFLGKLIKKAAGAVRKAVKSPLGKSLGGLLKGAVKTVLPMAGSALGTMVGGPLGTAVGGQLASAAGNALGLELEGMSQEDQEFEVARRVVRLSGEATKQATAAPATTDPSTTARHAMINAARKHAPGLVKRSGHADRHSERSKPGANSGRWIRRGDKVILLGL